MFGEISSYFVMTCPPVYSLAIKAFTADWTVASKGVPTHNVIAGRGRISDRTLGKYHRNQLFTETLRQITLLPGVQLFNTVAAKANESRLYERLLNRINRTLLAWDSRATGRARFSIGTTS